MVLRVRLSGLLSRPTVLQVSTGRARLETAFLQSNVHLKDIQDVTSRLKKMSTDGPDKFQASEPCRSLDAS